MSSSTLRFNRRVQALHVSKPSKTVSRRLRGPSHGLQGDASSQKKSGTRGTSSFRHSQVIKMKEKGAAAEVHVMAHNLPEVIAMQDYMPTADEPMDYMPAANVQGQNRSDWEDQPSDNEDEESGEDSEVENAARKVRVEYRDFRTRRDRTQMSNVHWKEQESDLVDAYMDWCLRQTTGEGLPPCEKPAMWLDIIDIFGERSVHLNPNPANLSDAFQGLNLGRFLGLWKSSTPPV